MLRCRPLDVADVAFLDLTLPELLLSLAVEHRFGVQRLFVVAERPAQGLPQLVGYVAVLFDDLHLWPPKPLCLVLLI